MPKPYSNDLRSRLVKLVTERGLSVKMASKQLQISYGTEKNWMKRFKSCGTIAAIKGFHKSHSHSITDLEKFRKMVASWRNWLYSEQLLASQIHSFMTTDPRYSGNTRKLLQPFIRHLERIIQMK